MKAYTIHHPRGTSYGTDVFVWESKAKAEAYIKGDGANRPRRILKKDVTRVASDRANGNREGPAPFSGEFWGVYGYLAPYFGVNVPDGLIGKIMVCESEEEGIDCTRFYNRRKT